MPSKFYLETSAVNYFLNIMTGADAQATREYQLHEGRQWYISTTVLWEIMQIKDFADYDAVLFLATFLFEPHLLKSAPEIVLDYFENGCPNTLPSITPFTASAIGKSWERACLDRSYSFNIIGTPFLELTKAYKEISRHLPYLYAVSATPIDLKVPDHIRELRETIDRLYERFNSDSVSDHIASLRRLAILLLFSEVCLTVDLTNDVLIDYWNTKGITSPRDRFQFLAEKQPAILHRGPVWNMANAILLQTLNRRSASRGAIHDGLHAVYLPYVDVFLTNDDHFSELREAAKKGRFARLYSRIYHLKEMKMTSTPWTVSVPHFTDGPSVNHSGT